MRPLSKPLDIHNLGNMQFFFLLISNAMIELTFKVRFSWRIALVILALIVANIGFAFIQGIGQTPQYDNAVLVRGVSGEPSIRVPWYRQTLVLNAIVFPDASLPDGYRNIRPRTICPTDNSPKDNSPINIAFPLKCMLLKKNLTKPAFSQLRICRTPPQFWSHFHERCAIMCSI